MEKIKKYAPLLVVFLMAVLVTAFAILQSQHNPALDELAIWKLPVWAVPVVCPLIVFALKGFEPETFNSWAIVVGALIVYAFSVFLMFLPALPPNLQWYYPIVGGCIIMLFV